MNRYGMIFYKINERSVTCEDFKESLNKIYTSCIEKGIHSPIFIMDNARIQHYQGLAVDEENVPASLLSISKPHRKCVFSLEKFGCPRGALTEVHLYKKTYQSEILRK